MKTLKYKSNGQDVHILEQHLVNPGYDVKVLNYFRIDTLEAGNTQKHFSKGRVAQQGISRIARKSKCH